MVRLLGNFPKSFTDALDEDRQEILVVKYPEVVDESTLPEGVKTVISVSHGIDNIDAGFLKQKGVELYRVTTGTVDVAEFTVAAAVMLLRRVPVADMEDWTKPEGRRLAGKKWGIIGMGKIGSALADMVEALGCEVVAFDPYVDDDRVVDSLDEIAKADVVSVHVPLTKETKGLVDAEFISKFSGVFIDVSRGGVVDTAAVIEALKQGTLFGAALDVFPEEPYSMIEGKGLNILATPHMASNTEDRWTDAAAEVNREVSK